MEISGTVLIVAEPGLADILAALLGEYQVGVRVVPNLVAAIDAIGPVRCNLVIVDAALAAPRPAALRQLRARGRSATPASQPAPAILLLGGAEEMPPSGTEVPGWDACLERAFTEVTLVKALQPWLDLGASQPAGRASGLADLLGREGAMAMIGRFHANLAESVAAIEAGGDKRAIGHRVGGLAGTLGFAVLSAAWLTLEQGSGSTWPIVRALTLEAIDHYSDA